MHFDPNVGTPEIVSPSSTSSTYYTKKRSFSDHCVESEPVSAADEACGIETESSSRDRRVDSTSSASSHELAPNLNSPGGSSSSTMRKRRCWSKTEDEFLRDAVEMYHRNLSTDTNKPSGYRTKNKPYKSKHISWSLISQSVPDRNSKQCRDRWNSIRLDVNRKTWTPEEDAKLIELQNKYSNRWVLISRFFEGCNDNMVKSRFRSLVQKAGTSGDEEHGDNSSDLACILEGFEQIGHASVNTPKSSGSLHSGRPLLANDPCCESPLFPTTTASEDKEWCAFLATNVLNDTQSTQSSGIAKSQNQQSVAHWSDQPESRIHIGQNQRESLPVSQEQFQGTSTGQDFSMLAYYY